MYTNKKIVFSERERGEDKVRESSRASMYLIVSMLKYHKVRGGPRTINVIKTYIFQKLDIVYRLKRNTKISQYTATYFV